MASSSSRPYIGHFTRAFHLYIAFDRGHRPLVGLRPAAHAASLPPPFNISQVLFVDSDEDRGCDRMLSPCKSAYVFATEKTSVDHAGMRIG